jgi:hypothetical protein
MAKPYSSQEDLYGTAQAGMERESELARRYREEAELRNTAAQQQLQQGLGQSQRNLGASAGGGGTNPFLQRAAVYSGGQLGVQGADTAQQLGAAETLSTQQGEMDAMARGAGYLQTAGDIQTGYRGGIYDGAAASARRAAEREAAKKAMMGQIAGGILSSGGAMMGAAASDERLKNPLMRVSNGY